MSDEGGVRVGDYLCDGSAMSDIGPCIYQFVVGRVKEVGGDATKCLVVLDSGLGRTSGHAIDRVCDIGASTEDEEEHT